jgi:hypothetical protein
MLLMTRRALEMIRVDGLVSHGLVFPLGMSSRPTVTRLAKMPIRRLAKFSTQGGHYRLGGPRETGWCAWRHPRQRINAALDTGREGKKPASQAVSGRNIQPAGRARNGKSSAVVENPGSASAWTSSTRHPDDHRLTIKSMSHRPIAVA